MKNDFLAYYVEHNISPVRQDISDIEKHYERRKKLYRHCGVPVQAFKNANVLEVGPGGGYNTLAFFHWGAKHIDLVEPNPKGREEMHELFANHPISESKYKIFPLEIEEYQTEKKYDVIVAEGFLPGIDNPQEVIDKIKYLSADNGIIVITCIDSISSFVEGIKALVGATLVSNTKNYNEKVKLLVEFFAPQLKMLPGVSRVPEDWVKDNILNPVAFNNGKLFSITQAIDCFREEFDIIGTSPQMFTEYSWYKDTKYNYVDDYKKQFAEKRYSLLLANMLEIIVSVEESELLEKYFIKLNQLKDKYINTLDNAIIDELIETFNNLEACNIKEKFNEKFMNVFYEMKEILKDLRLGKEIHYDDYLNFLAAFGRGQQYIAFARK